MTLLRLFFLGLFLTPYTWADGSQWILVDTKQKTLSVMAGDKPLKIFDRISVGRYGTTYDKVKGDKKTPLGRYRVAWLNPKSRFHYFIGLDYPTPDYTERSYRAGLIDEGVRSEMKKAFEHGRLPPQDTSLGGDIGIHGLGRGSRKVHDKINWTEGCVALTNEQINRLRPWIKIGTWVEIR